MNCPNCNAEIPTRHEKHMGLGLRHPIEVDVPNADECPKCGENLLDCWQEVVHKLSGEQLRAVVREYFG